MNGAQQDSELSISAINDIRCRSQYSDDIRYILLLKQDHCNIVNNRITQKLIPYENFCSVIKLQNE